MTDETVRPYLPILNRFGGEGVFGFLDAFEKYDPDSGCRFSGYLFTRTKRAAIDERRETGGLAGVVRDRRYGKRFGGGAPDSLDKLDPCDDFHGVVVADELASAAQKIPAKAWKVLWDFFVTYRGSATEMGRAQGRTRFAVSMQKAWALKIAKKVLN